MTRRQQFIRRQERYKRRRDQMYQRGWDCVLVPVGGAVHRPYYRRNARSTPLWNGPSLQYRGELDTSSPHVHLITDGVFPPATFTVSVIERGKPPHVHVTGFWRVTIDALGTRHLHNALVGYHRRRVKPVGHKPGRMNGYQRSCWGAAANAVREGWFPDWDPLHRHPTLDDVANGDPGFSGPFPRTPGH